MQLGNWFPNEEEALERGNRVLDALRDGSGNALDREMGNTVVILGSATSQAQRGVGHDFTNDNIYVRVHGAPNVSLETMRSCVSCYLIVRGTIRAAYVNPRVLVLSVTADDYQITHTT
jgi:hypothetical protein